VQGRGSKGGFCALQQFMGRLYCWLVLGAKEAASP
jgi:hypothetical protein